jgi:hypothetical protein
MSPSGRVEGVAFSGGLSVAWFVWPLRPNNRPSTPRASFAREEFDLVSWLNVILPQHPVASMLTYLRRRGRLRFTVCDQRVDILHTQTRICLVEPDRSPVRSRCKINEFLKVLPYG